MAIRLFKYHNGTHQHASMSFKTPFLESFIIAFVFVILRLCKLQTTELCQSRDFFLKIPCFKSYRRLQRRQLVFLGDFHPKFWSFRPLGQPSSLWQVTPRDFPFSWVEDPPLPHFCANPKYIYKVFKNCLNGLFRF